MFHIKAILSPGTKEAAALVALVVAIISVSIIGFEAAPHVPILLAILLLMCYGLAKKLSYRELERGLIEGAGAGMGAVFLFFFIGILISSWMMSGTIPTLIYAGFSLVTPVFFFAVVFVVTAIIG
ncbi:MAG: Na+/H+ antiporter NhaC, partial [Planococcus citreus]